jgi:uncharacterized protein (TIGR02145 family)
MLYPKQTNCTECGNIDSLLKDIDCKLAQLSNTMYNNIVFMLNKTISGTAIFDLLQYKRILYYKQINPDYVCNYSVNMITSKVKLLASNCVKNCFDAPPIRVTTTTTTTPCPTTTSTSTTTTTTTIKVIDCGESSEFTEGVSYPTTQSITLGSVIGTVVLDYDTQGIPDRFIVEWNGNVVIDTGYRGSNAYDFGGPSRTSFNSYLTGKIDPITLITYPNFTNYPLDGYPRVLSPESGTAFFVKNLPTSTSATVKVYSPTPSKVWLYTLFCPATTTTSTSSTTTTTSSTTTTTTTIPCVNCVEASVTIGDQIWDKCNLNVETYSDGTPIPQVTDNATWASLTTGAWCYYNNDPTSEAVYGKLYNWYAAAGIYDAASLANPLLRKNLAPTGSHVPTDEEWTTLIASLGGASVAGGKMKEIQFCHWVGPNLATNESGFTAFGAGYRQEVIGTFVNLGLNGVFWSLSENISNTDRAWYRLLIYTATTVSRASTFKVGGFSIRCLRD